MPINAGELDKRIAILRAADVDDGFSSQKGEPLPWLKRWARKRDVSDRERMQAGEFGAEVTSRFLVRKDAKTQTITTADLVEHKGRTYEIAGLKDVDDDGIEITASARIDVAPESE